MKGLATASAPLAQNFDAQKVQQELAELGESLNCDVTMEDAENVDYEGVFYAN